VVETKKEMQPRSVEALRPSIEPTVPVEIQPQLESWMQKIEKRFALVPNSTQTPMDDVVVLDQPQSQQPPVTLPVTSTQLQIGQKAPPTEGITWLVSWVVRRIKMLSRLGRRVRLKDMPEMKE
jgi:hypothetical protein